MARDGAGVQAIVWTKDKGRKHSSFVFRYLVLFITARGFANFLQPAIDFSVK